VYSEQSCREVPYGPTAPAINTLYVSMEKKMNKTTFSQLFKLISEPTSEFGRDGYSLCNG